MKTYQGTIVFGDRLRPHEYRCQRCGLVATCKPSRGKPTACRDCMDFVRRDAVAGGKS